ncbi:MAG: ATP-dependent protease ATPase subunit HslU [Spirochaetes bacterium]|nr:ATP-dependent protease ATPase subunit HslU [Spirochaetota bacterium]
MNKESLFNVPKPSQIVKELDKYIIGQQEAKKAVAIALRNRVRRKLLPQELQEEVAPKNIIMMGPTGIGKTEIARRLSNLAGAPFIKVEATKYTEVGYVGRDVESMIRDLTSIAVNMSKSEMEKEVEQEARKMAEERLLDLLVPVPEAYKKKIASPDSKVSHTMPEEEKIKWEKFNKTRDKIREKLKKGEFEDKYIEISTKEKVFPAVEIFGGMSMDDLDFMLPGFSNMMPKKTKKKRISVKEAKKVLVAEEAEKLIDMDKVIGTALEKVENMGIVFIDEIDKIIGSEGKSGPDVSREGVQRDLLPIVEGTSVMTKYGVIRTNHILFIAAGAFHGAKPSDLIPELQGRFPLRVELKSLTDKDFEEILTKPKNALTIQYIELLKTEGIELEIEEESINEIARIAHKVNTETEDIGARRLHTIMEKLLEDISFHAPEMKKKKMKITRAYVQKRLKDIAEDRDLSRYIL